MIKTYKQNRAKMHFRQLVIAPITLLLCYQSTLYAEEITEASETVENCSYDTEFSKALGVIVGSEISQTYAEVLDPKVFMRAILSTTYKNIATEIVDQVESNDFETKNDAVTEKDAFPTLASAYETLKKWPSKTSIESISTDFIQAYRKKHVSDVLTTESGLLYRILDADEDMKASCEESKIIKYGAETEGDSQTICFQREKIQRKTACEIEKGDLKQIEFANAKAIVDQFPRKYFGLIEDNMIAGWAEALDILNQKVDESGTTPALEVIIPAELAYQNDYVNDSVQPGEALWILLTGTD